MTSCIMEQERTDRAQPDDPRWQAVLARDRRSDGRFVFGVASTGIYCRPSCPARHADIRHVRFFPNGQAAGDAGLRPCKRCAPDEASREEAAVADAIAAIRAAEEAIPLEQLAQRTGYSAAHLQRIFTRATGFSPAAYARALRRQRAEEALGTEARVSDAIYGAGYSGPSRFYAAMAERGIAPSAWRRGGAGVTIRWAVVDSSFGPMLVAATEKGICRLAFAEGPVELARRFPRAELLAGGEDFAQLLVEVIAAVETPQAAPHIPLDVQGTAFQEAIWRELRRIPLGETRSYAQLAAAAGSPGAVRAAGSANAANPVAVLTPCHRVIRSDGSLGGYAYGLEIKGRLLERERRGSLEVGWWCRES